MLNFTLVRYSLVFFAAVATSVTLSPMSGIAQSNMTVTLNGLNAVTTTLLPALDGADAYVFDQCMENIWDCTPVTDPPQNGNSDRYDDVAAGHPNLDKLTTPPVEYDELPPPNDVELDCVVADTVVWNPQMNCRTWNGFYMINGTLKIDRHSFSAAFGNGGRLNTDFDLGDTELTVTLFLIGDRVENVGCNVWHPFEEQIIYAVDIVLSGISGSVDVQLAVGSDSTIEIAQIYENTLRLDFDNVSFDTLTDNRFDEFLIGASSVFTFAGNPLIQGLASLAWFLDVDVANVVDDLVFAIYGVGRNCGNTEDCLSNIATSILSDSRSTIAELITEAIAAPLSLDQDVTGGFPVVGTTGNLSVDLHASLSDLTTSAADDVLRTTWSTSVTTTNAGTCAVGLTGFAANPQGSVTPVSGDVVFTVPFDVVGQAATATLSQLNLCNTPTTVGPLTGQFAANGSLGIARGGPQRIDLSLPMQLTVSSPGNPTYTFTALMQTKPDLSQAGQITLVLDSLTVQSFSGPPMLSGPLQTAINTALQRLFPIPIARRSSVYVLPHVYIDLADVHVDTGSFSLGVNIEDGGKPVDIAVARFEGAAPYEDSDTVVGSLRKVPLWAIIENTEFWDAAPPVDVTTEIGLLDQLDWLPPLEPGEAFAIPVTAFVAVDDDGSVTLSQVVTVMADPAGLLSTPSDPLEPTIIDPDRDNNIAELTIDDGWFRPDYDVQIEEVDATLTYRIEGEVITSYSVVEADFAIRVSVRNAGGDRPAPGQRYRLRAYVNGQEYQSAWVDPIDVGDEEDVIFGFLVPEGPTPMFCKYDIYVELEFVDKNVTNNGDLFYYTVESSSCVGGGPTDADLAQLDQIAENGFESRWEGFNTVEWYTDRSVSGSSGLGNSGSNAPILDRQEEIPSH